MLALRAAAPAGVSADAADLKVKKAGAQFEAILLNQLFGDLERAFTDLPGKKEDHATGAYSGFAMQALASGLANAGGIGLGGIIANTLAKQAKLSR